MKKVYIAGPYSSDKTTKSLANIGLAIETYNKLLLFNFAPYCPHFDFISVITNFNQVNNDLINSTTYFLVSFEWLKVADCVLVIGNYHNSRGVLAEIEEANKLNIPVYYSIEELIKNEG